LLIIKITRKNKVPNVQTFDPRLKNKNKNNDVTIATTKQE
jgi:hypothetical protein